MRILVVDGMSIMLNILRRKFEHCGHTVVTAINVIDAVHAFTQDGAPFDVIVTDHDLGSGMTGVQFHRMLRPGSYRDKFVFFTADLKGLPKSVPAVEKFNFEELITIVEGLRSDD